MSEKYETLHKLSEELRQAEEADDLLLELWRHIGPHGYPEGLPRTREAAVLVEKILPTGFILKLQRRFKYDDS